MGPPKGSILKKKLQASSSGNATSTAPTTTTTAPTTNTKNLSTSMMVMDVNKEDFNQYVNFRILDSVGYPGAYRKFMLKRKEQGAEWAVKMNAHVLTVQHSIKELSIIEQVT